MTNSYNIGGIKQINIDPYATREYDVATAVNEQIDNQQEDWTRFFSQQADYFESLFSKEQSAAQQLIDFSKGIRTASKAAVPAVNWAQLELEYQKTARHYKSLAEGRNDDLDQDILNHEQEEANDGVQRINANKIVQKHEGVLFPEEKQELTSLMGKVPMGVTELSNINLLTKQFDLGHSYLAERLKLPVLRNGKLTPISYNEAVTVEEQRLLKDHITKFWMLHGQELTGNKGRFKRGFIQKLIEHNDKLDTTWLETQKTAVEKASQKESDKELKEKLLSGDGSFAVDYVAIEGSKIGTSLAKEKMTESVVRGIKDHIYDESTIESIKKHQFKAFDGSIQTPENYWKPQIRRMDAALRETRKAELEGNQEELQLQKLAFEQKAQQSLIENPTEENVSKLLKEYKDRFKTNKIPESISTFRTKRDELDDQIIQRLEANQGYMITEADVAAIGDPTLRKEWSKKINTGMNKANKDIMEGWVTAVVTKKTGENDGSKEKTLKYRANELGATRFYRTTFNAEKAKGDSDDQAHSTAQTLTQAALDKKLPDGSFQWDTYGRVLGGSSDSQITKASEKLARAILKDVNILDSPELLEAEDFPLLQAARYFSNDHRQKTIPEYYRRLAVNLKMSPAELMVQRLTATGKMKDGEVVFPERKNLNQSDQEKLLYRPSDARTYQVTQENKDLTWMIDTIASPSAKANGGYDAVRNPDGEYVQLVKPLSQHTIAEILRLTDLGYTNFGMFNLTSLELKHAIQHSKLTHQRLGYDTLFDVDTQDKIILATLRLKTQAKNQSRGIDTEYTRLVYVNEADKEKFLEIVGELPPWLQLENLIPEAAKALVDQTLSKN